MAVLSLQSYKTLIFQGFAKKKRGKEIGNSDKILLESFWRGFLMDLDV